MTSEESGVRAVLQFTLRDDGRVAVWSDRERTHQEIADILREMAAGFEEDPKRVG